MIPSRIVVDADSCPVKEEIRQIAETYHVETIWVASYAHYSPKHSEKVIYVDSVSQEVDMYIINHVNTGDIVVTGDYGLASLVLPKKVLVLSPRGKQYTNENIDQLLAERHVSAVIRKSGSRTKGPPPFTEADSERFKKQLINLLLFLQEIDES